MHLQPTGVTFPVLFSEPKPRLAKAWIQVRVLAGERKDVEAGLVLCGLCGEQSCRQGPGSLPPSQRGRIEPVQHLAAPLLGGSCRGSNSASYCSHVGTVSKQVKSNHRTPRHASWKVVHLAGCIGVRMKTSQKDMPRSSVVCVCM